MNDAILHILEVNLSLEVSQYELLDTSNHGCCFKFNNQEGLCFFGKYLKHRKAEDILEKEKRSLHFLRSKTTLRTPKIYGLHRLEQNVCLLLMEYIDRKIPSSEEMETFGVQLADMHLVSHTHYGWEEDNYLSTLNQRNAFTKDWSSFYVENRIEPLIKRGIDSGIFEIDLHNCITPLSKKIEQEIPTESPALIHGDLWGGNFIISQEGNSVLIDPALHYGHREMDLAMSRLFGSFGRAFYSSYQNIHPLEPGFDKRIHLHQLYPLLAHAILFKGDYIRKVLAILQA